MPVTIPTASEPTITVYTKTAWADSWTEQPLMVAESLSLAAAPSHPVASLRYCYGQTIQPAIGSRPADSSLATVARPSFVGKYVKINVSTLGDWYGVIQDSDDDRHGLLGGSVASGVFRYKAYGLTWFLDQTPILQSRVKTPTGSWVIDRALPFGWQDYESTLKCFSDTLQSTSLSSWTAANAIEYLLTNFPPVNAVGSVLIPFALDASALSFLSYGLGYIDYEGMTLWQILCKLIDRRRGLGWHTYVSSGTIKIKVWSHSATSVTLPGGSTVPANPDTMTYDFDNAVNVKVATVSTTLMSRFDQIVVRGERAGTVCSLRPQTNMEKDWSDAQRTLYNTAASTKTGYAALADEDKEAANMDYRAQDRIAPTFSWWRPKTNWDGRSATDPASNTNGFVFPKIDADGNFVQTGTQNPPAYQMANVQRSGLRIMPYLPMRVGVDYTQPIVTNNFWADGAAADMIAPMVFFKAPPIRTAAGSLDAGWIHGERMNQAADANSSKRPYTYSVDVAVREDAPGLVLRTVGKPQHYIAADLYVPNGSFENIAAGEGLNSDQWIATVYMQQDNYCKATWPATASLGSLDLIRTYHLHVPGSYLDYIVPGTIVAVDGGELQKTTQGGLLRDDRDRLRDIARLAYMWYGQERRVLDLSFRGITTGFEVGHLITSIGSGGHTETINTCITQINYNLQAGTTELRTQFGELDFVR